MGWGGLGWGLITSCCCIRVDVYSLGCVATSWGGVGWGEGANNVLCLHSHRCPVSATVLTNCEPPGACKTEKNIDSNQNIYTCPNFKTGTCSHFL